MAKNTAILSLGIRKDATTWEKGCKDLGFGTPSPIKKPSPTLDELKAWFKSKPHWIYFGGHFGDLTLSNEDSTVEIEFGEAAVKVKKDGATTELKKGSADFTVDANCEVVLWGGCSVCSGETAIRTMRSLLGNHVLLGFAGLTGWKMVDAMLGGDFIKGENHFFARVKGKESDAVAVRDAWMETAKFGYGKSENESKFRAVDPDGQEWKLQKGEIVRGRKIA
jgi:hypothetical protein